MPHDDQHDEQWVETPSAVVAAVCGAAVPWPPGHFRYFINTTRHVWARTQPARGQPWPVRVVGTPGALAGAPLYAQAIIRESRGPKLTNLWIADSIQ